MPAGQRKLIQIQLFLSCLFVITIHIESYWNISAFPAQTAEIRINAGVISVMKSSPYIFLFMNSLRSWNVSLALLLSDTANSEVLHRKGWSFQIRFFIHLFKFIKMAGQCNINKEKAMQHCASCQLCLKAFLPIIVCTQQGSNVCTWEPGRNLSYAIKMNETPKKLFHKLQITINKPYLLH